MEENNYILCLWSGGIDSTGMLYKLLTDKQYEQYSIHAHFIVNINKENRHEAELDAVNGCLGWFKENCRPFEYTQNTIEFSFLDKMFSWDIDVINFVTGEIVGKSRRNYIKAVGMTKSDTLNQRLNSPPYEKSNDKLDYILKSHNRTIERIFPVIEMTKKEVWDMMPKDLRKHTWSCRKPVYENADKQPVEFCKECLTVSKYRRANTWVCRRPRLLGETYKPCGKCKACLELRKEGIENVR